MAFKKPNGYKKMSEIFAPPDAIPDGDVSHMTQGDLSTIFRSQMSNVKITTTNIDSMKKVVAVMETAF